MRSCKQRSIFTCFCLLNLCSFFQFSVLASQQPTHDHQRALHRSTILIDSYKIPASAIVIPQDGKYEKEAQALQDALEKHGGARVPVLHDNEGTPEELLSDQSIIVLGNMATSRFIRTLYEQWYTLLDLRYPGTDGFVVRTLHNPYGIKNHVVLLGGSDDAGIKQATAAFIKKLAPSSPLTIGRLMEIKLGNDQTPPVIGEAIYSWDDSWRLDENGKTYGYPPATNFGWNPISTSAALYYMTGRQEYLDHFLELAMPNPAKFPKEIKKANLEGTPGRAARLHPIAYWHHYTSHIFPMIWGLIEDSPGITQQQRDAINRDLLAHTRLMEKHFNKLSKNSKTTGLSRHGLYYALNLYTASRHFNKHQPGQQWKKRLDSVSKAMAWWLQQPTWGERDTVEWINTSIEPVFTYYTLAGSKDFIDSGVAEELMAALDTLWQGYPNELSNKYQSISLMNKAAWLLNAPRYAWLAQQPTYDFGQFRIGQSWWPAHIPEEISLNKPFSIIPAAQSVASRIAPAIKGDKSFQFLAWRSGYSPDDDYLLLDGLNQGGRHPHHVAALTYLRHKDNPLLSGYENQLFILRDGLFGNHVPKAASLDKALELGAAAYIRTTVPDGQFATWQRHILQLPGDNTIVADKVTAKAPGDYELLRQWKTVGWSKTSKDSPRNIAVPGEGRVAITTDKGVRNHIDGARIDQRLHATLDSKKSITLFSSIHGNPATGHSQHILESAGPNAAFMRGDQHTLITSGPYTSTRISSDAAFSYLSPQSLVLVEGTRLDMGKQLILANSPISIDWQLDSGNVVITTDNETTVKLAVSDAGTPAVVTPEATMTASDGVLVLTLPAGTHTLTSIYPQDSQLVHKALANLDIPALKDKQGTTNPTATLDWPAKQIASFNAPVTHIVDGSNDGSLLWVATGDPKPALHLITGDGNTKHTIPLSGSINVMERTGEAEGANNPWMITGSQDNELRALNRKGDLLWQRTSEVADKFRQGSAYYAPWFTDPTRITGIRSLLVADTDEDGEKEIVVGRPSTIEYWDLDGNLLQRIPMPADNRLGTISEIELLATDQGKRILLGQNYCGIDAVSLLDENRNFVTLKKAKRPYLDPLPAKSTDMTAWAQRGISSLDVADLELDGTSEVIVSRSGHWNDLRTYSADGSTCRWIHSFGPANPMKIQQKNGRNFIRDILVADITGDNKLEVTVALANGYIMVFSADGETVWTDNSEGAAILGVSDNSLLAGFDDGFLRSFDLINNQTSTAQLGSGITALETRNNDGNLYAGTVQGGLFTLGPATYRH